MKSRRSKYALGADDYYYDDPVLPRSSGFRRNKIIALAVSLSVGSLYLSSTFAANFSLSSGRSIEFGQSVSRAVACSESQNVNVTPKSSFVSATNGTGSYFLGSIEVSNIPNSCSGVDFKLSAFGSSSSNPLAIFNSTSTEAVVYNKNGNFMGAVGSRGSIVSGASGSFTVSFSTPVALSSTVSKVTIQSGLHKDWKVGDYGPGGGKVFYVNNSGFACGPTLSATCNYLESALVNWNGGASDPTLTWSNATYGSTSVSGLADGVGKGYPNSVAIQSQNGAYNPSTNSYGAGAALAFAGGGRGDWYLPSIAEVILMKNNAGTIGGLDSYMYMSSNQYNASTFMAYYFPWSQLFYPAKYSPPGENRGVRPIRAF
jgi:hypothetical protein